MKSSEPTQSISFKYRTFFCNPRVHILLIMFGFDDI